MALNKIDLVNMLNEQLGISKKESGNIVESFFDIIKDELESGHDVKISSFGKWSVKSKKERKGRNPQTGESMAITARKVVTFKPSLILKNKLSN